jgi:hypothetical protein
MVGALAIARRRRVCTHDNLQLGGSWPKTNCIALQQHHNLTRIILATNVLNLVCTMLQYIHIHDLMRAKHTQRMQTHI